ncbi:MAG: hypothetical protein KAS32_16725 [Candidatus Peribacteraceae bacterium]|nr:hypothetical protein [Candidatus Peribacteraceae bacterium]
MTEEDGIYKNPIEVNEIEKSPKYQESIHMCNCPEIQKAIALQADDDNHIKGLENTSYTTHKPEYIIHRLKVHMKNNHNKIWNGDKWLSDISETK